VAERQRSRVAAGMPVIVGTAGHIDHGKTSLIKALTGQDTDRLKEEKERGISIDLGFAHLDLPDGTRAGVVDVPGHERFIRNMLAGAHGIDLVLFTVAADDGVMPQTEEHLDILHLLGIDCAIFVITKIDLASAARIEEVREEIQILAEGTSLQGSPIVPFSFVTGQGLDQLRAQIVQTLAKRRRLPPPGYFRLPVDRVFVLQGHGLVVTGTARSGAVKVGDRIRCLPGDQLFRVRSLQVHNEPMPVGTWGQRIALNLTGPERPSIERGDVICDEHLTLQSARFDATLDVRAGAAAGIKNHQRVRVHLGTAERLARLTLLGQEIARPKDVVFCQLVLAEPVLTLRGDHVIIRDETAQRTLGGGVVLHPWPKTHRKREAGLQKSWKTLQSDDLGAALELFLSESVDFALPIAPLYQFANRLAEETRELLHRTPAFRIVSLDGEELYTTEQKWTTLKEQLLAALKDFHATHPLVPGRDLEELRDRLPGHLSPKLFRAFVEQLEREKAVVRDGSLLRLPAHAVTLRSDERRLADLITSQLGTTPLTPPDLPQLEREGGVSRAKLMEVLRVLERERAIVRVAADLYYLPESLDAVKRAIREEFAGHGNLTPAMFRDRFGTSRKYTIPLLEYLDREGVTVRVGDARRVKEVSRQSPPPVDPHL
jgi:selenocysteine-specific elongation factor